MATTENYLIPTPSGETAKLSREQYDALIGDGGLSVYSYATIAAAAQLLAQVVPEPKRIKEIVRALHVDPTVEPSASELRALVALVRAGLVLRVGRTSQARYAAPSDS